MKRLALTAVLLAIGHFALCARGDDAPRDESLPSLEGTTCNWKGIVWKPVGGDWGSPGTDSDGQQIKDAGIRWARIGMMANDSFDRIDQMVAACKKYGIRIVALYTKSDPRGDLGTPAQSAGQATHLKDVVDRYKADIHYWEIQNEPNLPTPWKLGRLEGRVEGRGSSDPNTPYNQGVHRYVQWLQLAHEAVKSAEPKATVILGGLSEWIVEDFLDRLTAEGA
jgi:hypothetical protein